MEAPTNILLGHGEEVYLAGGCLWGVQAFVRYLPGVMLTEAGRANGKSQILDSAYDGYVECVRTVFDPELTSIVQLLAHLFEIIEPYNVHRQGPDVGPKYRTGLYSRQLSHLKQAQRYIQQRVDCHELFLKYCHWSTILKVLIAIKIVYCIGLRIPAIFHLPYYTNTVLSVMGPHRALRIRVNVFAAQQSFWFKRTL